MTPAPKPLVIPPPAMPAPKEAPGAADKVTMETDDGFSTFRVAGTDKNAVGKISKEAAATKKQCGCDCPPTGEPNAAEQVKKQKAKLDKEMKDAKDEAEDKKKKAAEEVKKTEDKAKKEEEEKKKETKAAEEKAAATERQAKEKKEGDLKKAKE